MTESELEAAIDACMERFRTAKTPFEKRHEWIALSALIAQRSPDKVKQMEKERGLA